MSNYARRKKKRKHAKSSVKELALNWWRSLHKRTKKVFALLSGLVFAVGLVASVLGIYSFSVTRISVTPGLALDQRDLFSTMFTVSNDGALPIYDVNTACRINDARGANNFSVTGGGTIIQAEALWATKIDPSEKMTVRCWLPDT